MGTQAPEGRTEIDAGWPIIESALVLDRAIALSGLGTIEHACLQRIKEHESILLENWSTWGRNAFLQVPEGVPTRIPARTLARWLGSEPKAVRQALARLVRRNMVRRDPAGGYSIVEEFATWLDRDGLPLFDEIRLAYIRRVGSDIAGPRRSQIV